MARDITITIENLRQGLQVLNDPTKAPLGSARVMTNMMISDRGGLTKRPGTLLYRTENPSTSPITGLYTFKKADGTEIMVKGYDDELEYDHEGISAWARLQDGFTVGSEWGFKEHIVNTENEDFLYMGNRTEMYRRWRGAITKLNGAYAGGVTLNVDSTLKDPVYFSGTASAVTGTTLTIAAATWATSQWVNFWVRITSGAATGQVRLITANSTTQLTFGAIAGLAGTPTFEIRQVNFADTGTLMVDGTQVAISAIPTDGSMTIVDPGVTFADDAPVTQSPVEYNGAPKGNRLETHYTRMIVGNIRSAISRDAAGNLQGSDSARSYFVSKLKNAADFTFSASRVAGEGDVASVAYGGKAITDIVNQEGFFYVFTPYYIEAATYSQDGNDLLTRDQLKPGIGSKNRVIRGKDDLYFMTSDNEFTSIGRVRQKDATPQSLNIGLIIKRLLDTRDFSGFVGDEFKNRLLLSCKTSEDDAGNNRILIYNQATQSFEGDWLLGASAFTKKDGNLYLGESFSANVIQMFIGESDVRGSTNFPITSEWISNWMNLTPTKFEDQAVTSLALEGYIRGNTTITVNLYKDFSDTAALSFNFSGSEESLLSAQNFNAYLGGSPLATSPLGSISDPDPDGFRHFSFVVYFPEIYGLHFSAGIQNTGTDQNFDITRLGLGLAADVTVNAGRIKSI